MFALANLVRALGWLVGEAFFLAILLVIARALLSWVDPDPYNPIVRFVRTTTEPLLGPFRKILSPWRTGGIDLSPLFALLALKLLEMFLVPTIYQFAETLH